MTEVQDVDYGAGNLRSAVRAVERLGGVPHVSGRAADISDSRVVVMPDVVAPADTMRNLRA